MGWFKKKPDPISERARDLNDQIAALESEIQRLAAQQSEVPSSSSSSPFVAAPAPAQQPVAPASVPSSPSGPQPRLRSTARPRGLHVPAAVAPPIPLEPLFEEARPQLVPSSVPEEPGPAPELGTRRFDLAASWQRMKGHFRGPATSNPKLVSYLAAGSIQGLRPLRYEKRVARNRFILLVIVLALTLWGIIWIILRNR